MSVTTAEIKLHAADPVLAFALAANDDIAAAARLSELLTESGPIPIGRVAAWGAATGLRAKIQDYANTPEHPLRDIALTALDLLVRGDPLDLQEDGALLDAFVAAAAITEGQRDALAALALKPRTVTANDVARAIRNDDGSSRL